MRGGYLMNHICSNNQKISVAHTAAVIGGMVGATVLAASAFAYAVSSPAEAHIAPSPATAPAQPSWTNVFNY